MRYAVLALIAAFPFAALACKKKGDAALISDAGSPPVDAGTVVAASASSSAPLPRVVSLFDEKNGLIPTPVPPPAAPAAPRTWTGNYKCKARLSLTQVDLTIVGRMTIPPDDTSIECSLQGDVCVGTETEAKHPKAGKPPPPRKRKLTLRRDSRGDLHYNVEGGAASTCPKL